MATTNLTKYSQLETPCFIFHEAEFYRGVREFQFAMSNHFRFFEIGYSVKTNSLPFALATAKHLGCMAEVVSADEYNLARLCGYDIHRIIYNGPLKSKETFLEAIENGAIVNIETKREICWLNELPSGKDFKVGIRLNINLSKISPANADGDNDDSRFGFSDETTELCDALNAIASCPNVTLSGIHIHRTTHSRNPAFYFDSIEFAAKIVSKYHLSIDYIDIGGGYFGIFPNKPTFEDYAQTFKNALSKYNLDNVLVIVEPGNALTASSFEFLSEVIDVKHVDNATTFITTDGSRNDIDPFFRKSDYLKSVLRKDENLEIQNTQIVSGCTCLEYDRLFSLHNEPLINIGDRILFHNVGAYTLTLSPQFIRLWPMVYAFKVDDSVAIVRPKSEAKDLVQK